jgi:hypothetical protein
MTPTAACKTPIKRGKESAMKIEDFKFARNRSVKQENHEVFAEEIIDSLTPPCSDRELRRIVEKISAEANQVGAAYWQEKQSELEAARADKNLFDAQAQERFSRLEKAERELEAQRASRGSLILAAILLACVVACVVADFTPTWNTLPYVLEIKKHSIEGVLLALAPAVAVAILKVVIGTLVWDRWHAARSHPSLAVRIAGWVLIAIFMLPVGGLTIYTMSIIAPAREEVVKARQNLDLTVGETPEPVDMNKIDRAILWVSITAAVNGALFFLIGMKELNTAYWRSLLAVLFLRSHQRSLKGRQSQAEARLNTLQEAREHIDERVQEVVEAYRSRLLILLERALKRPRHSRPYLQKANEILAE